MIEALDGWRFTSPVLALAGVLFSAALYIVAWRGIPLLNDLAGNAVQRIAKNSAVPIASQLTNRAVDLVFAAFALRLLGVAGNGQYAVAVVAWLYLKTISDFGLSVLVTREAARHPDRAGQLLGASTLMRIVVLATVTPLAMVYVVGGREWFELSSTSAVAIVILILSIIPGSYGEAVNSIFNARERMELPAILNIFTNLSRAGLGLAALFAGYGVIGLAVAALVATTISAGAYHVGLRHVSVRPAWSLTRQQASWFLALSWPLLLNALLLNLFFRVDVFVIQATHGDAELGVYDAAYKFINMLIILPAYFTLAVFPILSRYAISDRERLIYGFRMASKLMLIIAWPITLGTMAIAPLMIRLLGGDAFLPDSATALRILIWFLPLSYVNGVTQYVLIAANHQKAISVAFAIAVGFNIIANLALVPAYGYLAAAVITIATEFVLLAPLWYAMSRYVGDAGWVTLLARPSLAAVPAGIALWVAYPLGSLPALGIAGALYAGGLWLTGTIGRQELAIARALVRRPASTG